MRHALVIAQRELAEKRFVVVAAAAFAALPFLLVLIPGIRNWAGASDAIAAGAGLLGVGFTGGLALVLGGNIVGRDLAENRLSFYFSRPIGAASIWFGKVAAALTLIVAAFLVIIVPARLTAEKGWMHTWGKNAPLLAAVVIGGSIALFVIAHVVASFIRSRSAWIAVDFAAFCLAVIAAFLILRPLFDAAAFTATKTVASGIAAGAAVALIGGGAWQLERGRTDRKRSHRALSQFLWMVIGVTLVLAGAFVAWMTAATPSDLTSVSASMPRSGEWLILYGSARGRMDYRPLFAFNAGTGKYERIAADGLWRAAFTRDGKSLLIARAYVRQNRMEIFIRPMSGGEERSSGLTLQLSADYVATDDASRIAAIDSNLLAVYDVAHQRLLASQRMPEGQQMAGMYFASPDLVRIITTTRGTATPTSISRTLRIYELDVPRRALRQTGELTRDARHLRVTADADGSRLLVRDLGNMQYVLDGRTGALRATFPSDGAVALLRDGMAVERHSPGGVVLDIYDARDTLVRSIPIPGHEIEVVRELLDGNLLAAVLPSPGTRAQTMIIDRATGAVQRIPAAPLSLWTRDDDPRRPLIDRPAVFLDGERLVRWDYAANK